MAHAPIQVGQSAPDFELAASVGVSPLRLSSLRGSTVVLAFYVLDFTST
ncbi:MAG: redoxin domain-containing protein [Anaerolineales bacterium]